MPSDSTPPEALLVVHHFRAVRDPRQRAKVVYPLETILLIVFAAVLCGLTEWDEMALFAHERAAWLRTLVPLPATTPSADTLRRVFDRLNPRAFTRAFEAWMAALAGRLRGEVVALDGKSVLGATDPATPSVPLHLLHAFATGRKVLLAARAIAGAPAEPPSIPAVLALLDLRGAVVTTDANGCTQGVTAAVVEGGADYVVHLKANRGALYDEAAAAFAARDAADGAGLAAAEALEAGVAHGRDELRATRVVAAAACPAIAAHFVGVQSVACIERVRRTATACAYERTYYLSSLAPDARRLARIVRAHWGIENHLHGALDVVLHEDRARIRKGPAAENLAIVRRGVLALLRRDTTTRLSLRKRTQRAALNDDYRRHLLTLGSP